MKKALEQFSLRLYISVAAVIVSTALLIVFILSAAASKKPAANPSSVPPVRANQLFAPDNAPLPALARAHLISKIDTDLPVVFLTMDDGERKDQRAIEFLQRRQWPVSLFLTEALAGDNHQYFKKIVASGATVQNHTLTHAYLDDLTYDQQKREVCGASEKTKEVYGRRPSLLRPPGGHYDYATLSAAYECGISAVVMWSAKVDGGEVQFQIGDRLLPGDIVLMHFRPKIMEDLAAFEAEIIKQGLYVARLEDWIRIAGQ